MREREKERERGRKRDRERERIVIFLKKGMTGALAPLSYLVDYTLNAKYHLLIK